eukprot:COSAG02_NODE_14246_length_1294_cov_1.082008_2_plen_87_part_00
MPSTAKLFIRNKVDDFIAELTVSDAGRQLPHAQMPALPEKIVLTGFSRDNWVLKAEARPERRILHSMLRASSQIRFVVRRFLLQTG